MRKIFVFQTGVDRQNAGTLVFPQLEVETARKEQP